MGAMKIAILGCGYMGTALLLGLLKKGPPDWTYAAHVTSPTSAERIEHTVLDGDRERVAVTSGESQLLQAVGEADVVFLGVQPKDLRDLFDNSDLASSMQDAVVISMLAGVSVEEVQEVTSASHIKSTVARVIPTLGALNGDSVTLLAEPAAGTNTEGFQQAEHVLAQIGSIIRVPESLMNSATAIGAAVHALAIVAVDSATDASVATGMPREVAKRIAAESLRSCSGLMSGGEDAMSPEQVKAAMSTPAGITLNAVVNLDKSTRTGIASVVKAAVDYTNGMNG